MSSWSPRPAPAQTDRTRSSVAAALRAGMMTDRTGRDPDMGLWMESLYHPRTVVKKRGLNSGTVEINGRFPCNRIPKREAGLAGRPRLQGPRSGDRYRRGRAGRHGLRPGPRPPGPAVVGRRKGHAERRAVPDHRIRRLSVRYRRPPVPVQDRGRQRPVAGDHGRRASSGQKAVPHLLPRPVLQVSPVLLRHVPEPRPGRERPVRRQLPQGPGVTAGATTRRSRAGSSTASAAGCTGSSSTLYTRKVWAIPCKDLSADWAKQRIQGLSLRVAVRKAIFGAWTSGPKTLTEEFLYPRRGPGEFFDRLRDEAAGAGRPFRVRYGRSRGGARRPEGVGPWRRAAPFGRKGDRSRRDLRIEHAPAPAGRGPPAPAARPVLAAAARLRFRSYLVANVILGVKDLFPDQWIYVHSPEVRMGRIQNYKNWSPDMTADPDRTSLGLEYFCDEGDALWSKSDPELIDFALGELARIGIGSRKDLIERLRRTPSRRLSGLFPGLPGFPGHREGLPRPLRQSPDHRPGRPVSLLQFRPGPEDGFQRGRPDPGPPERGPLGYGKRPGVSRIGAPAGAPGIRSQDLPQKTGLI